MQLQVDTLQLQVGAEFDNEASCLQFLDTVNILSERHRQIATEGALLGCVLKHGCCTDLVIVSDGARQFDVLLHALCWIHTERWVHKTLPLNEMHRQEITQVRGQIWELYADLKAFTITPGRS